MAGVDGHEVLPTCGQQGCAVSANSSRSAVRAGGPAADLPARHFSGYLAVMRTTESIEVCGSIWREVTVQHPPSRITRKQKLDLLTYEGKGLAVRKAAFHLLSNPGPFDR
jgi:hypothetical protein